MKPYYEDEGTTIYLADNREALPELPASSVDMVFTSPPYNLGNSSGGGLHAYRVGHYRVNASLGSRGGSGRWKNAALANGYGAYGDSLPHDEYVAWQRSFLTECWRLLPATGAIYYNHKPRVFNGVTVTPLDYNPGLPLRQIVIWARAGGINCNPTYHMPTCEWLLILAKPDFRLKSKAAAGVGDVWRITQETDNDHPAPFPVELPKRALETTTAEVILDPFMGSGTTGVACAILGRKFVGIELEEKYCELAVARIKRAKGIACDVPRLGTTVIDTPLFNTREVA